MPAAWRLTDLTPYDETAWQAVIAFLPVDNQTGDVCLDAVARILSPQAGSAPREAKYPRTRSRAPTRV